MHFGILMTNIIQNFIIDLPVVYNVETELGVVGLHLLVILGSQLELVELSIHRWEYERKNLLWDIIKHIDVNAVAFVLGVVTLLEIGENSVVVNVNAAVLYDLVHCVHE